MFKSLTQWAAAAILSVASVGMANAVTVNYAGTVDSAVDSITFVDLGLVGTSFSGSLTYDETVTQTGGVFLDAITAATITLGGTPYSFSFPAFSNVIDITNTASTDGFSADFLDANGSFQLLNALDLSGSTYTNGNGVLPTNFAFDFTSVFVSGFAAMDAFGILMDGTLTSLATASAVPEPSILGLLGIGLVGMFFGRRKLAV